MTGYVSPYPAEVGQNYRNRIEGDWWSNACKSCRDRMVGR